MNNLNLLAEADEPVIMMLVWLIVIAILVYVVRTGVRLGMKDNSKGRVPPPLVFGQQPPALPVPTIPDGPGTYRVEGVEKTTGEDKIAFVDANTAANARAKGELAGMIVTSVTKKA